MMQRFSRPLAWGMCSVLLLSAGCQVYNSGAEFVHQRYVNTVAYFNTYYNAKKAFGDAEKLVLDAQAKQPVAQTGPLSASTIPSDAKIKFNLAIEKASKLLSFYPTSKWVDDALLLIGKSYYYLGDDLHAERKFLEMFAKYPNSDLRFEAELWYGRSLLRENRADEGIQSLSDLYTEASKNNEKKIAGLASNEAGTHFYWTKDYERAIPYFKQSMAISPDDLLNAQTQLKIANCYREMGDTVKAMQAYEDVENFSPDYETSFAAELDHIEILSELHRYDEALNLLNALLDDAKNAENFPKIQLEVGKLYEAEGKLNDAIEKFSFIDTAYARTEESCQAYYRLGQIYEIDQRDYAKAFHLYQKAQGEAPSSAVGMKAGKRADAFQKYFLLWHDIAQYDSLIHEAGKNEEHEDSVLHAQDTVVAVNADSAARADSLKKESEQRLHLATAEKVDSLRMLITKTHFELGGIFYLEIEKQDSALYWYQRVVGEGGKNEYADRSLFTMAEISRTSPEKGKLKSDSLYAAVIDQYPQSPYAQESRRILGLPLLPPQKDTAEELYLKAEKYMDGTDADSALPFLYSIVKKKLASPYSPKALYAIGWLYENKLDQRDSASAVYRRLMTAYPSSEFAVAVRPKIQEEDAEKKEAEEKAKADAEAEAKKKKAEEDKKGTTGNSQPAQNPPEKKEKP
ncbi:MAG TPA: tetratricopeptide repeat protein [Bacteroidota bacterium]|nr:tetratricopeptide repeat protein [Bacteroidota bacterium]